MKNKTILGTLIAMSITIGYFCYGRLNKSLITVEPKQIGVDSTVIKHSSFDSFMEKQSKFMFFVDSGFYYQNKAKDCIDEVCIMTVRLEYLDGQEFSAMKKKAQKILLKAEYWNKNAIRIGDSMKVYH